jgi:hypothetical protein
MPVQRGYPLRKSLLQLVFQRAASLQTWIGGESNLAFLNGEQAVSGVPCLKIVCLSAKDSTYFTLPTVPRNVLESKSAFMNSETAGLTGTHSSPGLNSSFEGLDISGKSHGAMLRHQQHSSIVNYSGFHHHRLSRIRGRPILRNGHQPFRLYLDG